MRPGGCQLELGDLQPKAGQDMEVILDIVAYEADGVLFYGSVQLLYDFIPRKFSSTVDVKDVVWF